MLVGEQWTCPSCAPSSEPPQPAVELGREYTLTGPWTTSFFGGRERLVRHITFFEADYFGQGEKHRYVRGHKHIEYTLRDEDLSAATLGPAFDGWQDGHPVIVEMWERKVLA